MVKNTKNRLSTKTKSKVLGAALDSINKDYGAGSIMLMGDGSGIDVEVFSTGSLNLDDALGVGGLPRGRIVEIYGPESSGKSTLAMHVIASAQKSGGTCAYIDAEYAMDPGYAAAIGVDVDSLLISQPDTAQVALEVVRQLTATAEVSLIVVDSVAALVPRQELEGEVGDSHIGLMARLMSQALRMLAVSAGKTNTTLIFINQIREKVGVMFGSPETTPGGRALKFYSSVRLDIRRRETKRDGDDQPATNVTRVKVVKNKVAPPFREAMFEIVFGEGISFAGEVIDWATDLGVMSKKSSWLSYGDPADGGFNIQGYDKTRVFLTQPENKNILDEIYKKVWALTHDGELPNSGS